MAGQMAGHGHGESTTAFAALEQGSNVGLKWLILSPFLLTRPDDGRAPWKAI
jgi:hypothetical protein